MPTLVAYYIGYCHHCEKALGNYLTNDKTSKGPVDYRQVDTFYAVCTGCGWITEFEYHINPIRSYRDYTQKCINPNRLKHFKAVIKSGGKGNKPKKSKKRSAKR